MIEWPTIALARLIYGGWLTLTFFHAAVPIWLVSALGAWLVAWHSSLQHELLHGHPTPWPGINRAIGLVPLSLWLPYDIYRASHLAHHRGETLTDPQHDPESCYWRHGEWSRLGRLSQFLVRLQTTLIGRLTLGPAFAIGGLFLREIKAAQTNPRASIAAWRAHLIGSVIVVVWIVEVCKMSVWFYLFAILYPAMSLSLLRSFAEHHAADASAERTAIVENARVFRALFLFNNLHVVHHDDPKLPWYLIPSRYREHRESVLRCNGETVYDGYFDVARRFLFSPHHDPIYPMRS